MVFTTIEITFVSFAVVLLTILFLLLLRGGFFSLPAHSAALPETRQRDLERELRQQRAQKKSKKAAEQAKAHSKYEYIEPIPQPQKKKEKEYATVLNISKAEGPAKPKVAKAKANVKPKAAVEKPKDKAENKAAESATPASAAPKRKVSVKFAEGEKREHNASRTEPRQPRPPVERKEREPPRIICYNCGHLGHTSKECPSAKETLLCFSCGELGHFSKDCPEKNNPARFRCYKCGGHGHLTKDCPERKKPEVAEEEAVAVEITEEITADAE